MCLSKKIRHIIGIFRTMMCLSQFLNDVSYAFAKNRIMMRLFARLLYRNGNRNRCADHGVVAHSDEAHHLYVSGNGGGA